MPSDEQLRAAHDAAILLGLDRESLLAAFDRPFVVHLRSAMSDTAQLWDDLCALRRAGDVFLHRWLETAALFAEPRPEAALFRGLAAQLDGAEGANNRPVWSGTWVGRSEEMALLAGALVEPRRALKPVAICALNGMAGVGKTYLAERFAWEHADAFPGGVKRLAMRPDEAPTVDDLLGELAAILDAPTAKPPELRARLLFPRALVHVDNADDLNAANAAAGLARKLDGCALVVTGRYAALDTRGPWTVVSVAPFDEETAIAQLSEEGRAPQPGEREAFARLAAELGYLPLALSLAAAHLRDDLSPDGFLERLRRARLDMDHPDPTQGDDEPRRRNVAATFSLSLELLRRSLGESGEALLTAFYALGHAPAAGVGASLGAAIAGLSEAEFRWLAVTAGRLSLLDRAASTPPRWRIHPLLAALARDRAEGGQVLARMTEWFVARLPERSKVDTRPQGERWEEVHAETAALVDWLARAPREAMPDIERAGSTYAMSAGPFAVWAAYCERILMVHEDSLIRSNALWTLGNVALSAGDPDRALTAAQEMARIDIEDGRERGAALAASLRADILQARGELDEALRILQDDVLSAFDKLGAIHERAVTMGKIADILQARGELDEALRIRQEDELPVYEKLGDIRSRAVTMGQIADIMEARGELDEALRIRKEEQLPVYDKLGDIRSRAVTMGKIADIMEARGELDEALRIRKEEQLPVYDKLGDIRERAVTMGKIADILQARGELDEALRILQDDVLSAFDKLGAIRESAVTMGQIADILCARGELDEALRIRKEDELPVYEKLGDIRERAVTMGQIADILQARGELDEALHIYQTEVFPVYEQLGDRRMLLVDRTYVARYLLARNQPSDREEAGRLLRLALTAATEMRFSEVETIRSILQDHGFDE